MKKPENGTEYRRVFDAAVSDAICQGLRIIGSDLSLLPAGTRIASYQKKAALIRKSHEEQGLLVPPVIIASITSRCTLSCAGCYMKTRGTESRGDMSTETLSSIVDQAAGLGVSVIVIAGGEPLVRKDEIFALARAHPALLFPVFTNGLLIDHCVAGSIAECRNIVPVISFEGFREETDSRRGCGVFDRLLSAGSLLRGRHVFFGCSVTTTRENFSKVTDERFVRQMLETGARVFTFVEYVPMEPGTENLVLSGEQKRLLPRILAHFNRNFPALFIGFPGEEDAYGGCLAAGRGFVHVSPSGNLEPCPAAPVSDANLGQVPLREALSSQLLQRIRNEHGLLSESAGGCALRANRVWLQELAGRP